MEFQLASSLIVTLGVLLSSRKPFTKPWVCIYFTVLLTILRHVDNLRELFRHLTVCSEPHSSNLGLSGPNAYL